jgi:hypothetical protein
MDNKLPISKACIFLKKLNGTMQDNTPGGKARIVEDC